MTDHALDMVYLCDWLPPDFGAVGQYALQFSREQAQLGKKVALYGLSSKGSSTTLEEHAPGALKIVRLKAATYDRTSLRARAWWTLKTNTALVWTALGDIRRAREVLFTGSPPFLLHFLAPLNLLLRKRLVYRITDFYPECLIAEYNRAPGILKAVLRLTQFWRRLVTQFEALGEDQRRRLVETGIPAERIVVKRYGSPITIDPNAVPLPRPQELSGYRVLLYSGNFGVAHDYATFLEGYRRHHASGQGCVALWLNAVGRAADALEKALVEARLPYARTRPVPLNDLPALLVAADAHLITLREPFWGYVLPSKVHACLESRRPILYIGPEESDVVLLGRKSTAAFVHMRNGDADGVKKALDLLASA